MGRNLQSFLVLFMFMIVLRRVLAGYYYDRPQPFAPNYSGHKFRTLSTVVPLPSVPSLPPLPTPRLQTAYNEIRVQTSPSSAAVLTSSPSIAKSASSLIGRSQALRIVKQSLVRYPASKSDITFTSPQPSAADDIYTSNDGQLKQYAVIEIIENDIENHEAPFLKKPFFDSFHKRIDTIGIGVDAFSGSINSFQAGSLTNSQIIQPQYFSGLSPVSGDAIALGSGGLGYIRLANGNIYLGSGSLGYISGQQLEHSIRDARTRSGSPNRDVLRFRQGTMSETL